MSGARPLPRLITETADFRIYEVEVRQDRHGKPLPLQLCEELVEGRWEPFYSLRAAEEAA